MKSPRYREDERGATAIFVAILASLMLMVAALAVDMGNAWARKRDVQTQVDVSALSAGHLLPAKTPTEQTEATIEVANYLNRENNQAVGQAKVTPTQLRDGDNANGEVIFRNDGKQMQVIAPGARVDFGFAGLLGEDGTDVQAAATIELQSPLPPRGRVLPFAIPDQCPFGPGMADTGPGKTPADTSGTFSFSSARAGEVTALTTNPSPVLFGSENPATATVTLSDLGNGKTSAEVLFQRGGAGAYSAPVTFLTPTIATGPVKDETRNVTVPIPDLVLDTAGDWNVWGYVDGRHTKTSKLLTVPSPPTTTEIGCSVSANGEFGQLYSPRGNADPDQRGLALNIAEGLDHDLYPFRGVTSDNECGKKTLDPPAGGIQDEPFAVKPNCVLPQTGNDGPWMLQGLITGIDGKKGRLDASREDGDTTCGPHTNRTGNVTREGVPINNDTLSCFLKPGYTLDDLAKPTLTEEEAANILDRKVVDSPRFMWIPVIFAPTRADIDNNTFYKLKRFVPAFLTDESRVATNLNSDATADNGVVIAGQLESLQIFMFNAMALPVDERGPTTEYDPLLGRIIRLID